MKRIIITVATTGALAFPAAAMAYWPQPTVTKQLGNKCSVTAAGIVRVLTEPNHFSLTYGGGTSCAGGTGNKSLVAELQIQVNTGTHVMWYPIRTVQRFNYRGNPLRLVSSDDIADACECSHDYRISATATDTDNGVTKMGTAPSAVLRA